MTFEFEQTSLPDVYLVYSPVHADDRGSLREIYDEAAFSEYLTGSGFTRTFYSRSREGVLRGLHQQEPPHAQSKLVSCLAGAVFDVAVDLRPESDTYGRAVTVELSESGTESLLVPRGFAHGYLSLSDDTLVHYMTDEGYEPGSESGIHWASDGIDVEWPRDDPTVSEKDDALPTLAEYSPTRE